MNIQGVCCNRKEHCPQQNALLSSYSPVWYLELDCGKSIIMHYYIMFDIMHYFSSNVGFTNIVVWSIRKAGSETKYGLAIVRGQCR